MISTPDLVLFIASAVALSLAPGPDNVFVMMLSALHGPRAGVMVTFGLCTGLLVHTAAVVLGVAVLVQTSQVAFTLLKLIGASYLLFLAWGAFRTSASELPGNTLPPIPMTALYRRGIVMNVTNPKVVIFFLAFLPQFADPTKGPVWIQTLLFGAVFILCAMAVFCSIAWGSGFLGDWLRRTPRAEIVINRIAGAVFLALAVRLMTTQR